MDSNTTGNNGIIAGVVVVYVVFIIAPSFILNGLILLTFFKVKELRSPSNLLSVHFSVIGIIVTVVYSPFALASFVNVMLFCDCSILYYHWCFGHVFHFGLYPLNILVLTLSYLLIIKFSASILTLPRAFMALIIIWIISVVGNFPTVFITTPTVFIDCCETVCNNGSALCSTPRRQSFTPRTFSDESSAYFHIRDGIIIIAPSIIVFIVTASSYYIYRKASMNSSFVLEVRMLLLPILMTLMIAVYLLSQDIINWLPTQTTDEEYPGNFIYILLHLLRDINGVVFPILILFFNVKMRVQCFEVLKCRAATGSAGRYGNQRAPHDKRVIVSGPTT